MPWPWMSVGSLLQQAQNQTLRTSSPTWSDDIPGGWPLGMDTSSTSPAPATPAVQETAGGLSWADVGYITMGAGAASQLVGTFFSVRAQQSEQKALSLSMEHESSMAAHNARAAEQEAQSIVRGGQHDIAIATMQAGADKSAARADAAGRGVLLGVGSAAEIEASINLVKEMDVMAIRSNTAQAAAAARTRGVNARNAVRLGLMSARNARRNAGNDFLPVAGAASSLLTTGSRIGAQWVTDRNRST